MNWKDSYKVSFLKTLGFPVFLIFFDKWLKIFFLHRRWKPFGLSQAYTWAVWGHYFAWCSFSEFLNGVEIILEDNRELGCSFICIQ